MIKKKKKRKLMYSFSSIKEEQELLKLINKNCDLPLRVYNNLLEKFQQLHIRILLHKPSLYSVVSILSSVFHYFSRSSLKIFVFPIVLYSYYIKLSSSVFLANRATILRGALCPPQFHSNSYYIIQLHFISAVSITNIYFF